MIIDCNAHLGYWPFRHVRDSQPDEFVALMDSRGIGQAWVAPFQGVLYGDVRPANDWLIKAIGAYGERLIPHAAINPNFPEWERDFEEAVAAGFVGLRLYPNYHSYELGGSCMADALAAAGDCGMTAGIHLRMYDERLHHPRCMVPAADVKGIGAVAEQFAQVPIVLCNIKTLEIQGIAADVRRLPNLHVEISNLEGVGAVEKLVAEVGAESVVFGTHAPYQYMDAALLKMRESQLSGEDGAAVFHGNAARWMGLSG